MIKINICEQGRDRIEQMVGEDIKSDSPNALMNVLSDETIQKEILKRFPTLYEMLYDVKEGTINEEKVRQFLLADREGLKAIVDRLGMIENDEEKRQIAEKIFLYDSFSSRKVFSKIVYHMNVSVCPYCNRQYVTTLENNEVRAQIDHYYARVKYPYLAMSINNLIPCCSICNQKKSTADMFDKEQEFLYPYEEEVGYRAYWVIKLDAGSDFVQVWSGKSDKFSIEFRIDDNDGDFKRKVSNQIRRLKLVELYSSHKDYVMDILRVHYINSKSRLKDISSMVGLDEKEVNRLRYMNYLDKDDWGKRPLAKLTHDIVMQLN